MSVQTVLAPLFVEVALTFVLLIRTALMRRDDIRSGAVATSRIALGEPNWPPPTTQFGNSFRNQFELPVLFYVLTVLAIVTRHADLLFVVMAWLFALLRIVHATIHTTNNIVLRRGMVYGVGAMVLILMWAIFAARMLLDLP